VSTDAWRTDLLHDLLASDIESKQTATLDFLLPGEASTSITYQELSERATRVAASLQRAGLAEGEHVLIMMDNSVEVVAVLLGTSMAGGVSVPINTATRGASLAYLFAQVEPKFVFIDQDFVPLLGVGESSLVGDAVVIATHLAGGAAQVTFGEFTSQEGVPQKVQIRPSDPACILYTSGSTGAPKGVVCSHGMMSAWAHNANLVMDYGPRDRVFIALPIFHANALCCALLPALKTGASVVISARFSATTFFGDLVRTRATTVNLLGTMEAILRKRGVADADRRHGVDRALVIPAPLDQREFRSTFGMRATTLYGLTDSGIPLGVPAGSEWPNGSCGRPNGTWDVTIVDEDDERVPPGEPGFLLVRPNLPNIMMLSYLHNPEATLREWRDLWFRTSDRMRVDDDGWFYFAGRSTDSIRRGGENISALEVENVLNAHPAVSNSAVVAVDSDIYGQEVLAFIEGALAHHLDSIIEYCSANLPYFAVPRYFDMVEELPRTLSEKIDKPALRSRGLHVTAIDRGVVGRRGERAGS